MALGTILGFVFGMGLVGGAIFSATDNFAMFISVESLLIVIGGTLASAFISFEPRYVIGSLKELGNLFKKPKADRKLLTTETGKIIRWGFLVKKHGILALEREIKSAKSQDPFMRYGVELVITGYTGEEVRAMLLSAAGGQYQRGMVMSDILKAMGATAPAFGMIGTLIGLIVMLGSLGGEGGAEALGQGLSVALMTTLYGVLVSCIVFIPASAKTAQREGIMRFRNFLITEGFVLLAESKSPRFIQDKMNSYLDPKIHYSIEKSGGGGGKAKKAA